MNTTLSPEQFALYLSTVTPEQATTITIIRDIINDTIPSLVEHIDDGKWFGGLITYHTAEGKFLFALGSRANGYTTFHMISLYASKDLQERHNPALIKFHCGKSCIKFKNTADLPMDAIIDIIKSDAGILIQK